MRKRLNLIAAICIACWFAIVVFPVAGYNSINVSSETDLSLNISEPDNIEAYPEQEICQNCSDNISVLSQNLTNVSLSDTVDYSHYSCQSRLWIVDYWGNHYPCNSRCIFLKDMAKMIISPCKTGYLKLYEQYSNTYLYALFFGSVGVIFVVGSALARPARSAYPRTLS